MDNYTARLRIAHMERSRRDHDRNLRLPLLAAVRQTRRWSLPVIATLAVAALAVLPGRSGVVAVAHATAQPRPTIVLIHGAWADASSWSGVVRRLQRDGYTVDAPPNPLRGVPGDSAYLASFLTSVTGPVVLVGHSYGGMVITNAAIGNANVKALVYVDAYIPVQGETIAGLTGAKPGFCLASKPADVFNVAPYPGASTGDADLYVKPALFPQCFANGLPAEKGAVLASTQRPLAASAIAEPSGAPAWTTIPSWSLIGTDDNIIPPAEQRVMSQRAHAHITEIRAPHLSMIAHPEVVTDVILQAVRATG